MIFSGRFISYESQPTDTYQYTHPEKEYLSRLYNYINNLVAVTCLHYICYYRFSGF